MDHIASAPQSIAQWNRQLAGAEPEQILRWAAHRWGARLALSCSFGGAAGMALLHMVASVAPRTTVLVVDTDLLFRETYELIAHAAARYRVPIKAVRPRLSVSDQARTEGPALWEREPDRCCTLRKVAPLGAALAGYGAWVAGVRRSNSATRAAAQVVEWSDKYQIVKLNPLVQWSDKELWAYVAANDVPYNALLDRGYRSIGCQTCTSLPRDDDPRSGRWEQFGKTECGLHVEHA